MPLSTFVTYFAFWLATDTSKHHPREKTFRRIIKNTLTLRCRGEQLLFDYCRISYRPDIWIDTPICAQYIQVVIGE